MERTIQFLNTLEPGALFDEGRIAFRQERYKDAAVAFELFVRSFPADERHTNALYNAGLSRERLQQWEQALLLFNTYVDVSQQSGEKADGQFRVILCYLGLENGQGMLNGIASLRELKLTWIVLSVGSRGRAHGGGSGKAERAYQSAELRMIDGSGPFNEIVTWRVDRIGEIYRYLFDAVLFRCRSKDETGLARQVHPLLKAQAAI